MGRSRIGSFERREFASLVSVVSVVSVVMVSASAMGGRSKRLEQVIIRLSYRGIGLESKSC